MAHCTGFSAKCARHKNHSFLVKSVNARTSVLQDAAPSSNTAEHTHISMMQAHAAVNTHPQDEGSCVAPAVLLAASLEVPR
jgi:hypothetical protein